MKMYIGNTPISIIKFFYFKTNLIVRSKCVLFGSCKVKNEVAIIFKFLYMFYIVIYLHVPSSLMSV